MTAKKYQAQLTGDATHRNVAHLEIIKHETASGHILRWAVITTACGFPVTGKPAVTIRPDGDVDVIGRLIAISNAEAEMRTMMMYAMHDKQT